MPIKGNVHSVSEKLDRSITAGLAIIIGVSLAFLAVPFTMAAIHKIPGDPALHALQQGRNVSQEELMGLIESYERAGEWVTDGATLSDLSLAHLRLAQRAGITSDEGKSHLEDAIALLEEGLSKAPANTFAWARLSYLRLITADDPRSAVAPLLKSIEAARDEPSLMISRLRLGLTLWGSLTENEKEILHDQMKTAWSTQREAMIGLAGENPRNGQLVRLALGNDPENLAVLDGVLEKAPPGLMN